MCFIHFFILLTTNATPTTLPYILRHTLLVYFFRVPRYTTWLPIRYLSNCMWPPSAGLWPRGRRLGALDFSVSSLSRSSYLMGNLGTGWQSNTQSRNFIFSYPSAPKYAMLAHSYSSGTFHLEAKRSMH